MCVTSVGGRGGGEMERGKIVRNCAVVDGISISQAFACTTRRDVASTYDRWSTLQIQGVELKWDGTVMPPFCILEIGQRYSYVSRVKCAWHAC